MFAFHIFNVQWCEFVLSTAKCELNKTEASLQMIYQLLPVKELLPTVVVQRLQPHLLWTLEYTVRIAGRLAKKDIQKVAISCDKYLWHIFK